MHEEVKQIQTLFPNCRVFTDGETITVTPSFETHSQEYCEAITAYIEIFDLQTTIVTDGTQTHITATENQRKKVLA